MERAQAGDVVVAWQQNDYGQLGRSAEGIAHALVDEGLARRVAYVEPQIGRRLIRRDLATIRGLDVHRVTGIPRIPPTRFARGVLRRSRLDRPTLINCGLAPANWLFHRGFAPHCSKTVLVVHDVLHLWPGQSDERRAELEHTRHQLIAASDVVVGLSEGSIADIPGATYAGHGCDDHWRNSTVASAPEPPDLSPIPRPRAIYLGHLSVRIDVSAMQALASAGISVVLLGHGSAPAVLELIERNDNVHFLGQRVPAETVPYLLNCDVGISLHTDDPFTATMEPHKLYNYACAGLRSVTLNCAVPRPLADVVTAVSDSAVVVSAVRDAVAMGRLGADEVRMARSLTWRRVAREILRVADGCEHAASRSDPGSRR